jgi:ABC-2 type transport system permease protein
MFISGVFIPIEEMQQWRKIIASISPLTYLTDLVKYSTQGTSYHPLLLDFTAIVAFTIFFLVVAIKVHEKLCQKDCRRDTRTRAISL